MVTSNANKAAEVAAYFYGKLQVDHIALEVPEHRSDDVGEIARGKAEYAYHQLKTPLIVDDTAFSIDALNGFPGPFAAYVLSTIGNRGILLLMKGRANRTARFTTGIAYVDNMGIQVFKGTLEGRITMAPRGNRGFGYDPIFEVGTTTLAERAIDEKSAMSHRAKALAAFHDWFMAERFPCDNNS
jgi:XTP/dITP diphosphohydrolase